jgi:hypothetical protein
VKKALSWVKKWGTWILGGLLAVLTLGLVTRFTVGKLGKLKDEKLLVEATTEVRKLQAVRAEVTARAGEQDVAVEIIDRQIEAQKLRAVSAFEGGEGLTDAQLEEAFQTILGR